LRKRNLSIVRKGIEGFGTGEKFTPIDLVMKARSCDANAALYWLLSCRTTNQKPSWSMGRRRLSGFVRGECGMVAFRMFNGPKTIARIRYQGREPLVEKPPHDNDNRPRCHQCTRLFIQALRSLAV
jgi:hypothetical protein